MKTLRAGWLLVAALGCLFVLAPAWAADRGVSVVLKQSEAPEAPDAGTVQLYGTSHALVIGIDNYTQGWPRLSNAVRDARLVAEELRNQGFGVELKTDLDSGELEDALENFFIYKGMDRQARLFVWFAGHGHTLDGEGFLIPADAPRTSQRGLFKARALSMRRFGELVRLAESKHALAVFDSCFSGTIFDTSRGEPPPAITRITAQPVRQYVASGDADQDVSDDGTFRELFLRAVRGEERADANMDGYLTGTELGLYLSDRVSNLTQNAQTPKYGKLRDHRWDQGDFVFLLAGSGATTVEQPTPRPTRDALLSVESNVPGARVLLAGRDIGAAPVRRYKASPGTYELRVEKAGYDAYRTRVTLRAGRQASMTAYLEPAKPRKGALFVDAAPSGARVRILNIVPPYSRGMELEPGSYHLEVTADGYEKDEQWIQVEAGQDRYVTVRLTEKPQGTVAGKKFTNSLGMEFVWCPPGTFMMGSPSNEPGRGSDETQHQVTLTQGFYMQTTEVTQGQWKRVMGNNPSHFKNCGDTCPVEEVSWNDAQEFVQKLNRMEGNRTYRLPTEAEWEYACRAGTETALYNGPIRILGNRNAPALDPIAWYGGNSCVTYSGGTDCSGWSEKQFSCSRCGTHPVGQKASNQWGLYDMLGNVWEWCEDWYGNYPNGAVTNPTGPSSGSYRVLRGGSWPDYAGGCRSAFRLNLTPDRRYYGLGFRVLAVRPDGR